MLTSWAFTLVGFHIPISLSFCVFLYAGSNLSMLSFPAFNKILQERLKDLSVGLSLTMLLIFVCAMEP